MLLFAAVLLNPMQDPIRDVAIWIENDQIRFVGARNTLPTAAQQDPQTLDLGASVISPGFINTHAHLELSSLAGLRYPGDFVDWIGSVLAAKQNLDNSAQDLKMQQGILQVLQGGTTAIGDHLSVSANFEILLNSPLRGKAFIEVLGVVPEVAREIWQTAMRLRDQYHSKTSSFELIPSPHSIHALAPEILAKVLVEDASVFSIHLSESAAEYDYFATQSGPMYDFIAKRGSELKREGKSAIETLRKTGQLNSRILAIHGNYLSVDEIGCLAEKNISLVHCPFSHAYFQHQAFPLEACLKAKLNIALGTDSLASAVTLSMFEVIREMKRRYPQLSREEIFGMATINGAKALKMEKEVGSLEVGKKADLIVVPLRPREDPLSALFAAKQVNQVMIGGAFYDHRRNKLCGILS